VHANFTVFFCFWRRNNSKKNNNKGANLFLLAHERFNSEITVKFNALAG
jgi:hypothetical protein